MDAYDFDNTIYDGESSFDFFKFCFTKDLRLIIFFPELLYRLFQYKINRLNEKDIRNTANKIINLYVKRNNMDYNSIIKEFWNKHYKKIKKDFINRIDENDLIITGCPDFLLDYIREDLKTPNIICTVYNKQTMEIEFLCFGENKVKIFEEKYPTAKIENFYTDSFTDKPFMEKAKKVYFVKNNKVKLIKK